MSLLLHSVSVHELTRIGEIPGPWNDIPQIRDANEANGGHWFSDGAFEFFDSRIESPVIRGRFFISSEQFTGSTGLKDPRRFKIRAATDEGTIVTLGTISSVSFVTAGEAARALTEFLDSLPWVEVP